LQLLPQAGVTGDAFNVWTGNLSYSHQPGRRGRHGTGAEWVVIQADCHYLLPDTIAGNTPSVPEPRFYGLKLTGLLGFAGMRFQKRRTAQANA
jgi:hypothetical protein